MFITIRWDAITGRWVLRVSRSEANKSKPDSRGNPVAPTAAKPVSKFRLDQPHPQPPRMKWLELAERLLDPARSPAVTEQEALKLNKANLGKLIRHADREQFGREVVLNAEQWGALEALRQRFTDLDGDAPGGEG